MENPQSHKFKFEQTFWVLGEGTLGQQKSKVFLRNSYVWSQTLKPSDSPSDEHRKPGSNQSLENRLSKEEKTVSIPSTLNFAVRKQKLWIHTLKNSS